MMIEPHVDVIVVEAKKFRLMLESCRKESILFVPPDFPLMSCKLASLMFVYHIMKKWPSVVMYGVSGSARNHDGIDTVSHYWLEYKDTAIDLTADQYNVIENKQLNRQIIESRPFKSVSTGRIGSMQNYKLFGVFSRDAYTFGLPELAEDFLENLQAGYESLGGLE